jgi:hypothetical protein
MKNNLRIAEDLSRILNCMDGLSDETKDFLQDKIEEMRPTVTVDNIVNVLISFPFINKENIYVHKLEFIKWIRTITGTGLNEAKDITNLLIDYWDTL